jgi:hypothetical protein
MINPSPTSNSPFGLLRHPQNKITHGWKAPQSPKRLAAFFTTRPSTILSGDGLSGRRGKAMKSPSTDPS